MEDEMSDPEKAMIQAAEALKLVERLAALTTPEEEYEERKANGDTEMDQYADADDMVSDMGDDRLFGEYYAFIDFIHEAKEIMK
jgi:regulator of sigma D